MRAWAHIYLYVCLDEVRELTSADPAQRSLFCSRRAMVIECSASLGNVTKALMTQHERVALSTTSALRHKQKGKALSVRKYKQKTGHAPKLEMIQRRKMKNGEYKEYVKIYDHSDSSSWSFEACLLCDSSIASRCITACSVRIVACAMGVCSILVCFWSTCVASSSV